MEELKMITIMAFNEHLDDYYNPRCKFKFYDWGYSIMYPYGVLDVYYSKQEELNMVLYLN